MDILEFVLQVVLGITSLLLTLLILLHKGRGGGLSDMFGGGMSSAMGSSGLAERNLNRITVGTSNFALGFGHDKLAGVFSNNGFNTRTHNRSFATKQR